jgi:hypothetical protein
MILKTKKIDRVMYICPFCKDEIVSSHKTEVFYRSRWIKGCNNCFDLSINILTSKAFQTKDY